VNKTLTVLRVRHTSIGHASRALLKASARPGCTVHI